MATIALAEAHANGRWWARSDAQRARQALAALAGSAGQAGRKAALLARMRAAAARGKATVANPATVGGA